MARERWRCPKHGWCDNWAKSAVDGQVTTLCMGTDLNGDPCGEHMRRVEPGETPPCPQRCHCEPQCAATGCDVCGLCACRTCDCHEAHSALPPTVACARG